MYWQPIETCKKRGEWIIAFNKFHGTFPAINGGTSVFSEWVSAHNLDYYYDHGHCQPYDDTPTHWMPLPEASMIAGHEPMHEADSQAAKIKALTDALERIAKCKDIDEGDVARPTFEANLARAALAAAKEPT